MYIEPGISQTDLRAGVSSKIAFYCMARSKGGKKKQLSMIETLEKKAQQHWDVYYAQFNFV